MSEFFGVHDLVTFKLKSKVKTVLNRFDELVEYSKRAGRRPPESVLLFHQDFLDIDSLVREQTEGKITINECRYKGLKFVSAGRNK